MRSSRLMRALLLSTLTCIALVLPGRIQAANLLRNASFEAGQVHWFLNGYLTLNEKLTTVSTGVQDGQRCVVMEKPNQLGEALLVSDYVALPAGTPVTLSVWLRSNLPGQGVVLRMWSWDAANIGRRNQTSKIVTVGTTWQRYSLQWTTLPAQMNFNRAEIVLQATGKVWVDAVQLEQGSLTTFAPKQPVELGLTPNSSTNVYNNDESVQPTINVVNTSSQSKNLTAKISVADFYSQSVSTVDVPVTVGPGQRFDYPVNLTPGKLGYFRVTANLVDSGGATLDSITWAFGRVSRMSTKADKRFGLCMEQENVEFELPRSKMIGAGDVRLINVLLWSNVEPSKGSFDWRYGQFILPAHQKELNPLITLQNAPSWALSPNQTMPADINDWKEYVSQCVSNYGQYMSDWEIWNEPAAWTLSADEYFTLLKGAYEAAKSVDPGCTVVGLSGFLSDDFVNFNQRFFQLGGTQYCDAVTVHPYLYPAPPEGVGYYLDRFRNMMGQGSKPIWATEDSAGASDWPPEPDFEGAANHYGLDEAGQARFMVTKMVVAFAHGVDRYYWFFQSSHIYGGGYMASIFAPDSLSSVKKAAPAYAVLARALNGLKFTYRLSTTNTNSHIYRFADATRQVIVAWNSQGSLNQSVWVRGGTLSATDIMGNPVSLQVNGEVVTLPLSRYPIYIETGASTRVSPTSFKETSSGAPAPLGMSNRAVGGGDLGQPPLGQYGATDGVGLNNVGLLVTVWGRVVEVGSGYVLISDDSQNRVRIPAQSLLDMPVLGNYIRVTGISGLYKSGAARTRCVTPRDQFDIEHLSP